MNIELKLFWLTPQWRENNHLSAFKTRLNKVTFDFDFADGHEYKIVKRQIITLKFYFWSGCVLAYLYRDWESPLIRLVLTLFLPWYLSLIILLYLRKEAEQLLDYVLTQPFLYWWMQQSGCLRPAVGRWSFD